MSPDLFSAESPEEPPRIYTVSELTRAVRGVMESAFDRVWVEGEISNLRVAASRHAYFVLKDEKAQIRCVLFKNYRAGLKFDLVDGDHVKLGGRMTVYDARGEYQIVVEAVEPVGLGALQKAFEQLKDKLQKEGLFDAARKRPLPAFPWRIGVITSPTGAAIRDILNILRRRNPKISVLVCPVKVQGEGAAQEIAAAIKEVNRVKDIDVLIVGRGGGSIEDLWAFNEEVVARALAASKIPVVSAVGHEIDFTIADFVADLRAPTPSAAAELTVPVLEDIQKTLVLHTRQMISINRRRIGEHREKIRRLVDRRFFRDPMQILAPLSQRLDEVNLRLLRGLGQWVRVQRECLRGEAERLYQASPGKKIPQLAERSRTLEHRMIQHLVSLIRYDKNRLQGVLKNLNAVNPLSVLDRGFSICSREDQVLKSAGEVRPGDVVEIRLSRGRLDCRVEKTRE